ncbi:DUF7344 domain-containing protein [Halopiger goleimassiliensis]|uniref:DUF7344 domain-containing protein n=1 Tax=Halopiger goleimassiliensis TaxID=1293048 RepID=UPI001E3A4D14|nr:ArsR family transcriptional regulator [Halopiger goleimassiliensis]
MQKETMLPVISDPESLSTPGSAPAFEDSDTAAVLEDPLRLAVLRYVATQESAVPITDLADHLTVELEDDDRSAGRIAGWGDALLGTRRRLQISLRHVHAPALADVDAVAFDIEENTLAIRERGEALLERATGLDAVAEADAPLEASST